MATAVSAPNAASQRASSHSGQDSSISRDGPRYGIAIDLAQQGVDESRGGGFVRALHQFDAVLDRGVRRNALQVANLVEAHAQRDAHLGIELARAAGMVLDQVIELGAIAQHAEDDLRRQSGVAGVERRGVGHQKVGSVASRFHFHQNVERQKTGGGDLRCVLSGHERLNFGGVICRIACSAGVPPGYRASCKAPVAQYAAPPDPSIRKCTSFFATPSMAFAFFAAVRPSPHWR